MAKKQTKNTLQPTLLQEVVAVFALVVGLFLLISILSFSPADPLLSDASQNWGGSVGQVIATVLLSFLGLSALWIPFLCFFYGASSITNRFDLNRLPLICCGCTGILLASCTLLGAIKLEYLPLFGNRYPLAGYLGSTIFTFSSTYFGLPGSLLFYCALMVLSLMAAVRFSPYFVGKGLVKSCDFVHKKYQENRKDKIEKKVHVLSKTAEKESQPNHLDVLLAEDTVAKQVPYLNEPVSLKNANENTEFEPLPVSSGEYKLPPLTLLDKPAESEVRIEKDFYLSVSGKLEAKLKDFGVQGNVTGISPGPVITTYEFAPAPGVKINKIVSLADDLALGLQAESVRIIGSIPGKAAIGIEIPNPKRKIVYIREILGNELFLKAESKLTIGLGMDVVGNPVCADLARMPHLLIAGATGAGKSVAINGIICSLLLKSTPEEVRLLMVDPKRIELSTYEAIPHLLHPVVVDPKMASRALQWAVREMERRYCLMEEMRVKSFASYNNAVEEKLPYIVIIIDELADLMMVSSNEVESAVARLAQMARAAGMHLILATQRPSVDVLTGLIKANFPTRMSFKVSSKIDSRTIIDTSGAEHLLGAGDMLFLPPGTARLQRIHGAFISEKESERIVDFLKELGSARYDESVMQSVEKEPEETESGDDDYDEKYDEAVAVVCELGQASISMVQRRLRVGYNRAARMIETMEREGIVGPADGSKPREVLVRKEY